MTINGNIKKAMSVFVFVVLIMLPVIAPIYSIEAQTLTTEDYLADYDEFWEVVVENAQIQGNTTLTDALQEIKEEYRAQIQSETMNENAFYMLMRDVIKSLDSFVIGGVVFKDSYDYMRNQLNSDTELKPFEEKLQDLYNDERTVAFYEAIPSSEPAGDVTAEVQPVYRSETKSLEFRLKDLLILSNDQEQDIISFVEEYPEVEHIIFNLTNNTNGEPLDWLSKIVTPLTKTGEYEWKVPIYLHLTDRTKSYYSDLGIETDSVDLTKLSEPFSDLDVNAAAEQVISVSGDGSGEVPERWVLIDELARASSQDFAQFCTETNWATVVGRPSGGYGSVGFPAVYEKLNNTGLLYYYDVHTGTTNEGRPTMFEGVNPNILSKPSVDPLTTCLEHISK